MDIIYLILYLTYLLFVVQMMVNNLRYSFNFIDSQTLGPVSAWHDMLTLTSDTKIALINYFSYWILFPEFLFSDDEEDCYESEAKLSLTPCHESPLPPSSLPSHSPLPRHAPDSADPTIKVCVQMYNSDI